MTFTPNIARVRQSDLIKIGNNVARTILRHLPTIENQEEFNDLVSDAFTDWTVGAGKFNENIEDLQLVQYGTNYQLKADGYFVADNEIWLESPTWQRMVTAVENAGYLIYGI